MDDNDELKIQQAPQGALVVPKGMSEQLADWGFGGIKTGYITSADLKTDAGRRLALMLSTQQYPHFDGIVNMPIAVVNWLVGPAETIDDKTGEVVELLLTRIQCESGACYQTSGKSVFRVLCDYHNCIRNAPWTPPARFIVRRPRSRSERYYYTLEPVFDDNEPTTPEPRKKK